MKITFLGTRGYIEARTRRHHMHSALMISYYGRRVMIDCGEDWLGEVGDLNPRALFTHCGSRIVKGDERSLGAQIREMAEERGVEAEIAYDGMEVVLR